MEYYLCLCVQCCGKALTLIKWTYLDEDISENMTYIQELFDFLKTYQRMYDFRMIDIIEQQSWKHVEQEVCEEL